MGKNKLLTFAVLVIALIGSIYILDQAGFIDISPPDPPIAGGLWQAQFLLSSDTDRTESGEAILNGGTLIRYELTDANMDGLGDVNLDVRVLNLNVGAQNQAWAFETSLTFVSTTAAGAGAPGPQPIVNRTLIGSLDERYAITFSLTEADAPTLSQSGERAVSNDWRTGASDTLNLDLEMSIVAVDDIAPGTPGKVEFLVGGIKMTVELTESA